MEKARITYRLDVNGRNQTMNHPGDKRQVVPLYDEEYQVIEEKQLNQQQDNQQINYFTTDFGPWNSPFDMETLRIEQLIRESDERNRQPIPKQTQPPMWNDGPIYETTPSWEGPIVDTHYIRTSNNSWVKLSATVAGAVITGVLFGYFVISMITGNSSTDPINKDLATDNTTAAIAASDAGVQATVDQATSAVNAISVSIPSRSYLFLQNGGFSTAQNAESVQALLNNKGLAAVTESEDKFFVYVGMAPDRERASLLSQQLKAKKIDIYLKSYSLPAAAKVRWNGSQGTLPNYLKQSDALVQMISGITLVHLQDPQSPSVDSATLQSLKSAHENWSNLSLTLNDGAPDEVKPILQKLNNAMNTAKLSIDEYKKNPSTTMLWQAQKNLMLFVLSEKELLNTLIVQ